MTTKELDSVTYVLTRADLLISAIDLDSMADSYVSVLPSAVAERMHKIAEELRTARVRLIESVGDDE